jgi:peptidoglycan/xylan/chitin deacetylase (PgdA/CDA1 family)
MMMRGVWTLAVFALVGCGGGGANAGRTESADGTTDTGRAAAAENRPGAAKTLAAPAENDARYDTLGSRLGRIPILEYHVIGDSSRGLFIITREKFRRDLQLLYDRGYRPITVAQLLDKNFSAVPSGMSPVVFTFDDASPEQFSYLERNGQLEIDSTTALGIWLRFEKEHPDWKGRATFCLLPGGEIGHAFFGDDPKWRGQKNSWRHRKVKWLADNGFELCSHTLWHAQLSKYPDAFVQEQIARGQLAIDSVVPGYKVRTFSLPQGLWPKNRELAWRGSWTNPRTGKTTSYDHETVLQVAGGPARSPFDPEFNRRQLPRVIVFGNALEKELDRLDATKARFVWPGSGVAGRVAP